METMLMEKAAPGASIEDLIETFRSIQDAYTHQAKHFLHWITETGKPVTIKTVKEYYDVLEVSGYAANTVRSKRQAVKKRLRQLFKQAPIEQRIQLDAELRDLDKEQKPPQVNTQRVHRDKVINRQEFDHILMKCRSARQIAFFRFLWQTGCRIGELTSVELRNCKCVGGSIEIRVLGKGNKERLVRISEDLYTFIRETFRGERYLFETAGGKQYRREYISNQVKKIGKLIGKNISAHILRHSWGTRKVQQFPEKLDAISSYLGHSSVKITLDFYVHSDLTDAELFS